MYSSEDSLDHSGVSVTGSKLSLLACRKKGNNQLDQDRGCLKNTYTGDLHSGRSYKEWD